MTLRESYTEPLLDWIKREALSCMFSGWPRYDTHRHMVSVLMMLQQMLSGRARCKRKAHHIRYRVDGPASSVMSNVPTSTVQTGQATPSEFAPSEVHAAEKPHDELASGSGGAREHASPRRQPAAPPGPSSAPRPETRPSPAMH
jgi:hypothetical protein